MQRKDLFKPPQGVRKIKFYFLLWKRYFEMGYNITGYVKYAIALFGISSLNLVVTMVLGALYGGLCFLVGYLWFRYGFMEADNEISNRFNGFVQEMRDMKDKVSVTDMHCPNCGTKYING